MYRYNSNTILTEVMKNREGQSILNVYEIFYNSFATIGLKSRFQKHDNEASNILVQSLQDKNIGLSWRHQTCIGTTQLKNRYKHSKTISLQDFAVSTHISHYNFGIDSCINQQPL